MPILFLYKTYQGAIINSLIKYINAGLEQQSAIFTRVGRYRVIGAAYQMGAVYFAECSIQFIE